MISCISCENAHLFGPAFHSQFQLRYRAFIERQDYDVLRARPAISKLERMGLLLGALSRRAV